MHYNRPDLPHELWLCHSFSTNTYRWTLRGVGVTQEAAVRDAYPLGIPKRTEVTCAPYRSKRRIREALALLAARGK